MSYVLSKGIRKIPKIPDKNYLKNFSESEIKPLKNPKTTI
jgi:hypothetical protein